MGRLVVGLGPAAAYFSAVGRPASFGLTAGLPMYFYSRDLRLASLGDDLWRGYHMRVETAHAETRRGQEENCSVQHSLGSRGQMRVYVNYRPMPSAQVYNESMDS